jgi:16S rRNA (cytidine1402-2'-O)-methyltransferase
VSGTLAIAATPIGNPRDASPRLVEVLSTADAVAAEDTRRLIRLARELDFHVAGHIVSFYEAVEQLRAPQLLQRLDQGQTVALVSDAGMPAVSDPGYRLIAAAAAAGHRVTVIPGPSAVLAALVVSGLPSDRFCFEGFPPRKGGERRRWLTALASEPRTTVFFESPRRLAATLAEAVAVLGPSRRAAVCRELTKTYEEVQRGTLAELVAWADDEPRGEITVVLEGASDDGASGGPTQWAAAVAAAESAGLSRKEAMKSVAEQYGVPKREVFDAVVGARGEP